MSPDDRFRAAVARWLDSTGRGPTDPATVTIDVYTDSGCDTCGGSTSVEVGWQAPGRMRGQVEVSPFELGAWIGGLLPDPEDEEMQARADAAREDYYRGD